MHCKLNIYMLQEMCTGTLCVPLHNKVFFSSIDGPLESNQKIPCCTVLPFIRVTCISVKVVDWEFAVTCACTL